MLIIALFLCIGGAGYASSVQSSLKTLTHDAYLAMTPEDKNEFELEHKCCGYDVIEEASNGCIYKVPCGKTFVQMVQKYPSMAITICSVGAAILVRKRSRNVVVLIFLDVRTADDSTNVQ